MEVWRFENQLHLDQRRVGIALINLPQENSQERPLLQTPCSGNCRIFGQLLSIAPSAIQSKEEHQTRFDKSLSYFSYGQIYSAMAKRVRRRISVISVSKNDGDLLHCQYRFTSSSLITSLFFKNNIPSISGTITFR